MAVRQVRKKRRTMCLPWAGNCALFFTVTVALRAATATRLTTAVSTSVPSVEDGVTVAAASTFATITRKSAMSILAVLVFDYSYTYYYAH